MRLRRLEGCGGRALRASALVSLAACLFSGAAIADEAPKREGVSELLKRGTREVRAEQIHPSIWVVSGNSNAYLVATPDGVVIIDTGLAPQAAQTRRALLAVAGDRPVRKLILTHAHEDHVGGAPLWLGDGRRASLEVITHRAFPLRQQYYALLPQFKNRRARVLWGDVMPGGQGMPPEASRVVPDVLVDDVYSFELGGVRFEVIATPGGEGPDAVSVWVPELRAIFTGDALGPTTATFPNLFTLRGENLRESIPMLQSIERIVALDPELLLPGHFDPLEGRRAIRDVLTRTATGIRYVLDATIAGMNAGKSVWTLMREIKLPPELGISEEYGRVPWGVRAIYELHTGWFRYESTTELYDVPPRGVYADLADLAGGPNIVALRANQHLEAGRPLQALHLAEVALAAEPENRFALETQLGALQLLAERDGGANFQLSGWLRHRIGQVRAQLDALAPPAPAD